MDLRGQRFELDLSDDEDHVGSGSVGASRAAPSLMSAFVGDIKERSTAPPTEPKMKSTPTGFPEHKKRTRISAFKQQRSGIAQPAPAVPKAPQITNPSSLTQDISSFEESERRRIDEENSRRLAAMSASEIEQERAELLAGLNPSLIERFLKRANLDDGRGDTGLYPPGENASKPSEIASSKPKEDSEKVTESGEGVPTPIPTAKRIVASKSITWEDDKEPEKPIDLKPASGQPSFEFDQPSIHFPSAPAAPDLDPSDPSFLENLHTKYFPNLPADPSKLAWMAPIPTHGSIADQESSYYPNTEALSASALRFDFRGGLLPPRISRAMPSTKGLHHHGEAPEAAGYTVPELARLARSAFPAQRCVAFQTLGRLLYRLGRGEWGDADSEITKGLWKCVKDGKVIETLEQAANAEGGHQGSKVYAVEAVWLWQKGGGQVWKAT
jgi:hypothetical protein